MSARAKNILFCIFSLIIGTFIYALFRENTFVAKIINSVGDLNNLRNLFSILACNFIKYYLCDYLWGFSLSCGLIAIYLPKRKKLFFCALVAFTLGCIWEFLQYTEIINGTGCFYDILMYLFASFTSIIINYKGERKL